MKKIFLILFISISFAVRAQTYYPFAEENKIWGELTSSWGDVYTTFYKLQGDTTINDTIYKTVYSSDDSLMQTWNKVTGYFIREDSSGKVYKYKPNEEILIYDFKLQPGDSTEATCVTFGQPVYVKVDSVDSVFIHGEYRNKIIFDSWFNEFWIEGIGSSNSAFNPFINYAVADIGWELSCVKVNDTVIYQNPHYTDCWVRILGIDELSNDKQGLSIFPNPSSDKLLIETQKNSELQILNIQGQILKNFTTNEDHITIDISAFANGLYFLKVKNEEGTAVRKFVKE